MRIYKFQYRHGQSAPYKNLEATDHDDFYAQLASWEKDTGFKHVVGSINCTISEIMHVPEPPNKGGLPSSLIRPHTVDQIMAATGRDRPTNS